MSDFRFLHAADIHLDSPLLGLAQFEESAAEILQTAARDAFDAMIEYAIEESVDFVIIAGDLYDDDWKDYKTGRFFVERMGRLRKAGIPAYILYGNHDAANKMTRSLRLPDNVHEFESKAPSSFAIEELGVTLHGRSFPEQHVHYDLVPDYPSPEKGHFNIGVLHTALEGSSVHANYAPVAVEALRNKGYQYWALGHVHEHKIVASEPHVVFPGNLQGRHARETGPKGACLVSVEDGGVSLVEHVPFDVARWAWLTVDVSEVERFTEVVDAATEAVQAAIEREADGRLLACRVELTGSTSLDAEIRSRSTELREELIASMLSAGEIEGWVEKVKINTEAPPAFGNDAEGGDALAELMEGLPEALEDPRFTEALRDTLTSFRTQLGNEVIEGSDDPALAAAMKGDIESLIEAIRPDLMGRLTGKAGRT